MNFARERSTRFHVEQRATAVRWHTKIQSCTEAGEPGLLAIKHGAAGAQHRVIRASLREHEETFLRIKKLDAGCVERASVLSRAHKRREGSETEDDDWCAVLFLCPPPAFYSPVPSRLAAPRVHLNLPTNEDGRRCVEHTRGTSVLFSQVYQA